MPSLDEVDDLQAEQAQKRLASSLDDEGRNRLFKAYSNPSLGGRLSIKNHFMAEYQPYIHNQLLEMINPPRLQARRVQREKFVLQMQENSARIPADEYLRNRMFLDLHGRLGIALQVTRDAPGGAEALQRFDSVTDPKNYCEKTYC